MARRATAPHDGIHCSGLVRIYQTSDIEVVALQGLDFDVEPGELVTIVGASGSGKSTLLHILGGLDEPTAGQAFVAGRDLLAMRPAERTRFRREVIGFVWQQTARNLLGYLDALANVEFPMSLAGVGHRERRERATWLLDLVGLGDRRHHAPAQLSGGEQQRVAIAVALANEPSVLLADEPTGELDTATAGEVVDLLHHVNRELGITGVIVTHDPLVSHHVDRTVSIRDGRISTETLRARHVDDRVTSEEFAVLDAVGRLQLPEHYVQALGLRRRVRLELAPDHIVVWPESATIPHRPASSPMTAQALGEAGARTHRGEAAEHEPEPEPDDATDHARSDTGERRRAEVADAQHHRADADDAPTATDTPATDTPAAGRLGNDEPDPDDPDRGWAPPPGWTGR